MNNRQTLKEILPYLYGIILFSMISFQFYQYSEFVKKGPRFTAYDGQELCERVKRLENESYRLRVASPPCEYVQPNGSGLPKE